MKKVKKRIIPVGYAPFKGDKLKEEVSKIMYEGKDRPRGYAKFVANKDQ